MSLMSVDFRRDLRGATVVAVLIVAAVIAGCARRTPPPALPTAVKHPEFMFPAVPASLRSAPGVEHIEPGWRYLQNDDLRAASREFAAALKRNPGLYPAHAGEGYIAFVRNEHDRALASFTTALSAAPDYVPALVGRGQVFLATKREPEALAAFEAALAADPSLTDVARRVDVLRFRNVQQIIEAARTAAAAGRADEAHAAYERALTMSPESAFLHRELAVVERTRGNADPALGHFRRAVELDATDAASLVEIGDLLAQRLDFGGAEASYRRAAALEPSAELSAKIAAAAENAREARLPAEFRAIPAATQVARGDLAALIGIRLDRVLASMPARQVVVTDTRGHWAADWIMQVARAGVIEPFENHTFQPRAQIRRGDLAAAVSRIVTTVAARDAALRKRIGERPTIADMSPSHLSYPAVAVAVSSGVMTLLDGGRFQPGRSVSGAEALDVIERLRAVVR
jgi:tetratricopeptide (TPR) repeat protein